MGELGMSCSESWPRTVTWSGLVLHPGKSTPHVLGGVQDHAAGTTHVRLQLLSLAGQAEPAACHGDNPTFRGCFPVPAGTSPHANRSPLEGRFASPSAAILLSLSLFIPNWILCSQLSPSVEML